MLSLSGIKRPQWAQATIFSVGGSRRVDGGDAARFVHIHQSTPNNASNSRNFIFASPNLKWSAMSGNPASGDINAASATMR
jgi:hypothetical protein